MAKLSNYASKLPTKAQFRYIQKLELITNVHPFEIGKAPQNNANFHRLILVMSYPTWCYIQTVTSFITAQQHKAQRPLKAYNQLTCGWVKDVRAYVLYSARVSK